MTRRGRWSVAVAVAAAAAAVAAAAAMVVAVVANAQSAGTPIASNDDAAIAEVFVQVGDTSASAVARRLCGPTVPSAMASQIARMNRDNTAWSVGEVLHVPTTCPATPPPSSSTSSTTTTAAPTTTAASTTTAAPTTAAPTTPATTAAPGPTTTMPAGMHMACPGIDDTTPIGAVPPALPMLCDHLSTGVPATFTQGANTWLDDFNHGASMTDMGPGYKRFEVSSLDGASRTATFRHNDHWMVDVFAPGQGVGGSMMRPDRSFRFENGKLIVETDVAAGIEDYDTPAAGGFAWPEITVSTASSPDGQPYGPTPARSTGDDLYAYGRFGGYDTVGIRLTGARPIMAYYDTTERGFPCGRVWELSWFQDGSNQCTADQDATIWGGGEWAAPGAVRSCNGTDPDVNCRDRFRWELTRDTITLYANGRKLMEHTAVAGKHLVPDAILNGDVYVYLSDSVYQPPADRVVRFHWDRVAVNPSTGPSASPTCSLQGQHC